MSLFSGLFKPAGLVCPRCEKSLEGHDEGACARRMSRRFFFAAVAGGAVAAAAARKLRKPGDGSLFNPYEDVASQWAKAGFTPWNDGLLKVGDVFTISSVYATPPGRLHRFVVTDSYDSESGVLHCAAARPEDARDWNTGTRPRKQKT